MSSELLVQELESLERKILKLLEANEMLKNEVRSTNHENQKLKQELKTKIQESNNFQNKSKITKLVGHVAVAGNTAELKSKINEYIKEIDSCIAHLSE